jgi:O-antigen/teichoic acid export membrane protein
MSRVRFNIAANLAGQMWFVFLAIVCTPFYIKLLGIEAYGLIAFYLVLQSMLQLLDFGLGATLNREVARLSGKTDPAHISTLARFVGTIERWYWVLGCGLGVVLFFATPHIAGWWLRPERLSQADFAESAKIFGVLAFLQWPTAFYQSGLLGLQRQVLLNTIQIPLSGLSSIGGLVVIWLGPRSVSGLFAWQAFVLLIQLAFLYMHFWKLVGVPRAAARVDLSVVRENWRFSLGMSGISITGMVLTHLDKIVLSRLLPLEIFGHYSLAGTLARSLYVLITPVFNAYFPRFSALVSGKDLASIRQCYHNAAQVMAALILPLAVIVVLFSREIAYLWLHDPKIAVEVASIASLLVVGTCLNGLMNIPFALQLAYGKTSIGLYINIFLVIVLAPAIIFATSQYGAIGGAVMWAVVNGLYLLIGVPVTHKYLLAGEAGNWVKFDVVPPLVVAVLVVGLGRVLVPHDQGAILSLVTLAFLWALATICAAMSAGHVRRLGQQLVMNFLRSR